MNEQNLRPCEYKFSQEDHKKALEVRRKKKTQREALELLMGLKVKDKKTIQMMEELGIKKGDMNNQQMIMVAMMIKASKGDVKAAEFIRDTMGQHPMLVKDRVEETEDTTAQDFLQAVTKRKNGFDEDEPTDNN